jgi:hypothetical protein
MRRILNTPIIKLLFGLIRESVEQDKTEQHEFVVDALPESLQARSRRTGTGDGKLERMEGKLLRGTVPWRDQTTPRGGGREFEPIAIPAGGGSPGRRFARGFLPWLWCYSIQTFAGSGSSVSQDVVEAPGIDRNKSNNLRKVASGSKGIMAVKKKRAESKKETRCKASNPQARMESARHENFRIMKRRPAELNGLQ